MARRRFGIFKEDSGEDTDEWHALRDLGMSITQAKRVLCFREERSFTTVDELDDVPGFSQAFLVEIKERIAL